MPKYQITEQEVAIGWKETKEIGKPTKEIVEYDSLHHLLEGEYFYNENYDENDENDENEYSRMITAIINDGGFMCADCRRYWEEPEPCDSYLTYGNKFEIKELSEEEFNKIEADKNKKMLAGKKANIKKWKKLKGDLTDSELVEKLMSEYKIPAKIKV